MKIGPYYFSFVAALSAIGTGAFLGAFALLGGRWPIIGAFLAAFCSVIAQSLTTQRTPSWSVYKDAPIINGDGKPNGETIQAKGKEVH